MNGKTNLAIPARGLAGLSAKVTQTTGLKEVFT
jgi:hypothetical protein